MRTMTSRISARSKPSSISAKRGASLAQDLDILFGDLCRHWGFYNKLCGADLTDTHRPLTADAFAISVLVAEGFTQPELEVRWLRKFRRLFVERYGSSAIAETEYAAS